MLRSRLHRTWGDKKEGRDRSHPGPNLPPSTKIKALRLNGESERAGCRGCFGDCKPRTLTDLSVDRTMSHPSNGETDVNHRADLGESDRHRASPPERKRLRGIRASRQRGAPQSLQLSSMLLLRGACCRARRAAPMAKEWLPLMFQWCCPHCGMIVLSLYRHCPRCDNPKPTEKPHDDQKPREVEGT